MATEEQKISAKTGSSGPGAGKSRPPGAIRNASWNAFFTLWNIAASFLLTPLLIHYVGTAQYGILLLIWSFTGMLGIMSFGLGEATLRYVAHYYADGDLAGVNRVFGATMSFYLVICTIVSGGVSFAAPHIVTLLNIPPTECDTVVWLLRISCLIFSFGIISRGYGAIPMALQRYDISSKINIGQSVVRSVGYIVLVISKFGILHLLLWDVVCHLGTLCIQGAVIRWLSPEVRLVPSFSFRGLRETFGYSIFSLLTYVFLTMFRESGKFALGRYVGPTPVAYLGSPDNVAQRIHMVIASGVETLLPKFSASRNPETGQKLVFESTWAALTASLVLLIPLCVLMPDFLSLWISPAFAQESAAVGQLLALSYITQGAFAPVAAYFRGSGMPWLVTVVIAIAGLTTLLGSVLLIPGYGVAGVGFAYFMGSMAHFLGLVAGFLFVFGMPCLRGLLRTVGVPLVLGTASLFLEQVIRGCFLDISWVGLFALGGSFAGLVGVMLFGADLLLGGESPSRKLLERLSESSRFKPLIRYVPIVRGRS